MSVLHVYVNVHSAFACPYPFPCRLSVHVCVCVHMCINAGMSDCAASNQSSTGMKKPKDVRTGPVLCQADAVQHFLVWYQAEMMDDGMPMPALLS